MNRLRKWWYRRTHRPFDWYTACPELRGPYHVRRVSRWPS